MMPKQTAQTSPGSVLSLRGNSVPGSPGAAIMARVEDTVIGYRDLAAIPTDKAILDIERPELIIYHTHYTYSPREQRSLSPRSISPPLSPDKVSKQCSDWLDNRSPAASSSLSSSMQSNTTTHSTHTPSTPHTPNAPNTPCVSVLQPSVAKGTVQHFHRPENGTNIYKKPPIYKQELCSSPSSVPQVKHIQDLIIESSKFPAAHRPDPNEPSKIETPYWPCPPSLAVIEKEELELKRKRHHYQDEEEEEEEEEEECELEVLQNQQLNQIGSNLGKLLLQEELQKPATPLRRKTRSLPDHSRSTGSPASRSSVYFPASSRSGLARLPSAEFRSDASSPTALQRRSDPANQELTQNGESRMDRGNSLPAVMEHKIFPYEVLVVTHRGRTKIPPGVDRTQLERHLSQQEFFSVFGMTLEDFDALSLWKKNQLKKKVCLF